MRAPRPPLSAGKAWIRLFPKPVSSPSAHRFSLLLLKQAQKCWSPLTATPPSELCNQQVLVGTRGAFSKQDNLSECCIISAFILGWKRRAFHFASPGAAVSPWAAGVRSHCPSASVTSGTERMAWGRCSSFSTLVGDGLKRLLLFFPLTENCN